MAGTLLSVSMSYPRISAQQFCEVTSHFIDEEIEARLSHLVITFEKQALKQTVGSSIYNLK